jgi:hypothetical protein
MDKIAKGPDFVAYMLDKMDGWRSGTSGESHRRNP